jgi:hypothetical protein
MNANPHSGRAGARDERRAPRPRDEGAQPDLFPRRRGLPSPWEKLLLSLGPAAQAGIILGAARNER